MPRLPRLLLTLAVAGIPMTVLASPTHAASTIAPMQQRGGGQGGGGGGTDANGDDPKPYGEVITAEAVTQSGYFDIHRV